MQKKKQDSIDTEEAKSELDRYMSRYQDKEDIREEIDKHGNGAEQKGMYGALKAYWQDIRDVVAMLRDVVTGAYQKEIPFATLAALTGAVAYIACPIDLVPDIFPLIGLSDDAVVFALALHLAQRDLVHYRAWRKRRRGR